MSSRNEVRLSLEVLEDRMALSGAFGGAIDAGVPAFPPLFGLNVPSGTIGTQQTGFRSAADTFNNPAVNPVVAFQNFQNQMQAFQSAQNAAVNQVLSDLQNIFQQLNIHTFLIL